MNALLKLVGSEVAPMFEDGTLGISPGCISVAMLGMVFIAILEAAGKGALTGFLALTLGQTILHAARPLDPGYVAEAHSTMQVGAVGGAILGVVFSAATVGLFSFGAGRSSAAMVVPVFTLFGAASGPLGVVILKHYRNASEQADMLDVLHAARAGAFGWFLLGVLAAQQYREQFKIRENDGMRGDLS